MALFWEYIWTECKCNSGISYNLLCLEKICSHLLHSQIMMMMVAVGDGILVDDIYMRVTESQTKMNVTHVTELGNINW